MTTADENARPPAAASSADPPEAASAGAGVVLDPTAPLSTADLAALPPGAIIPEGGDLVGLSERATVEIDLSNTGDRPIQVGSHFHFFETNRALWFDRRCAWGMRLNIPAGTAARFEPGLSYHITLTMMGGERAVYGCNGLCNGSLDAPGARERGLAEAARLGFKGA